MEASVTRHPIFGSNEHVFVLHARRLREGAALEDTSRFSDDVWRLEPAILQVQQTALSLNFGIFPGWQKIAAKELCYAMLSGPLPLGERRASISVIRKQLRPLFRFLSWLPGELRNLGEVDARMMESYHREIAIASSSPSLRAQNRTAIRLLWRYRAQMTRPLSFDPNRMDLWGEKRAGNRAQTENATDRIAEDVLNPLIRWSARFVKDFSGDILRAHRIYRRLASHKPHRTKNINPVKPDLERVLKHYHRLDEPLPGHKGAVNADFLAKEVGCSRSSIESTHSDLVDGFAATLGIGRYSALPLRLRGKVDGRLWLSRIHSSHESPHGLARLSRHLQAACYVLIAYFSGMRDSEIKHLKRGCLRVERTSTGVPYRHLVESQAFKGESDPAGVSATWVVGRLAALAIEVLEKLQPPGSELLFAVLPLGPGMGPASHSSTRTLGITATILQISAFMTWVNAYCDEFMVQDVIGSSPGKVRTVTTRQFRRTLAWHIARESGGSIAGAIQYRHQSVQMFEGYAGTSDSGFRAEVEAEQALWRGEVLLGMTDTPVHLELGGPSAQEAVDRLRSFGVAWGYEGKTVTDPQRMRRLMRTDDPAIYPGKFVHCVFDPAKALCLRKKDVADVPRTENCQPLVCGNVSVSLENTNRWREERLRLQGALDNPLTPPLIRRRVSDRAAAIDRAIAHWDRR